MILLGQIEDVFRITGRGVVVTLDFSESLDSNLRFHVGDKIELRDRNGSVAETEIKGIEFLKPLVFRKHGNIGFTFSPEVRFEDLNKGMEIWLLRD